VESYRETYHIWLKKAASTEEDKAFLDSISNNEEKIKYYFSKNLSFGTAGLRGTMNPGLYAMNVYTVGAATQGMANLIISESAAERGVAVGYDCRLNSKEFAQTAAEVLAGNGIKVYLFDNIRPTPVLSFAVRELGCIAGINVTASHNPKEYNGYKAYWEDGAQISAEQAKIIAEQIESVDIFEGIKKMPLEKALECGLVEYIGTKIDDIYLERVLEQRVDKNAIPAAAEDLKIVYTPLHGCGYRMVPEVLRYCGVKHLYVVEEQMKIDGNFPSVKSPNPEYPSALEMGRELALNTESDLVIATDPDADRVGIMIREKDGDYVSVSGNQVGALLLDYIITAYNDTNTMPPNPFAVKTVVSTELVSEICRKNGIMLCNVLTGFKYIGEEIKKYNDTGKGSFIFGFEESYGYLKGTYARDKDSVVASMLIAEMTAYYKGKGMTLSDALKSLYLRYGYYTETTTEIYKRELDGLEQIAALMEKIRAMKPESIGGAAVLEIRDFLYNTVYDAKSGRTEKGDLPHSNVMYFLCEGNDVAVIRPSGTEPKIKIYFLINGTDAEDCAKTTERFAKTVDSWLN